MKYISTRNKDVEVDASVAIMKGLSDDGGLFVPKDFPKLTQNEFEELIDKNYEERSAFVLSKFLGDFEYDELLKHTSSAYSKFLSDDPCPLIKIDESTFVLELWHGPTCAFKDMALTVLPHLMLSAREKNGEKNKTLILVATSGDTGKAALEGFKDVENCEIIVFYPSVGVSDIQRLQMITQEGKNVHVCAIEGNFDDCQNAVKAIFADDEIKSKLLKSGYKLSSANSINWGRLAPQIAYYVSSYVDMLDEGLIQQDEKINFCVPSGNFGNILAGYYAMRMGVPINKLICASNMNNVLTGFFDSGVYDVNREFYQTISPSMDILISSNLERLLFEICNRDDKKTASLMAELKKNGNYKINKNDVLRVASQIFADFADEDETMVCIDNFYDTYGYLLDPHTAVAMCVYFKYLLATHDEKTKTIVVSTASPYKFASDVYESLTCKQIENSVKATKELFKFTGEEIPEPLNNLEKREVRFNDVIKREEIQQRVIDLICK